MSALHSEQTTANGLHIVTKWEYATAALRDAVSYTAADEGGVARVGSAAPYTFHILSNSTGPRWVDITSSTSTLVPQPGTHSEGLAFHADYNNAASWEPNQSSTWLDLIGSRSGASTAVQSKGKLGFTGANEAVDFGDVDSAMADLFAGGGSLEVACTLNSDGELNEGRLIDAGDAGENWALYVSDESAGFVRLTFFHDFSTTGGVWSSTRKVPINPHVVVGVKYDSDSTANDPTFFLDGVTLGAPVEDTTPSGTAQTTTAGVNLVVGNAESLTNAFDGTIETVSAWDVAINDVEFADNYQVKSGRLGISPYQSAGDLLYATGWNTQTRLAIGSASQVLTVNAGATAPEWAAGGSSSPDSAYAVTHTGYGSTNTKIMRWTTRTDGTDITWTDSAANGSYVTVTDAGTYAVSCTVQSGSAPIDRVAINAAAALSNTYSASHILAAGTVSTTGWTTSLAWVGELNAGDVVWVSSNGSKALSASTTENSFDVALVSGG
jgi:nitrous oxide reductase accessory protein NosL